MNYNNMLTLKKRLSDLDAGSLLDIGVGRGDFLRFALDSFHEWDRASGIDIDEDTLGTADAVFRGSPVVLVRAPASEMPFITGYFDTVTISNVLHHVEKLPALFTETARVCKSNGLIVVNEMLNESLTRLQEPYMLYHRFIASVDNQLGRFHHEPFTLKELLSIVKNSGMNIAEYFIHEESTGECLNVEEVEAMSERMRKKVQLLKGSYYYYFYENKITEIINRLSTSGVHKPRHITFFLHPS